MDQGSTIAAARGDQPVSLADGQLTCWPEPSRDTRSRAATTLRSRSRRVVRAWASHAGVLPCFRARPELSLDDLLSTLPTIVDELATWVNDGVKISVAPDLAQPYSGIDAHARGRFELGLNAADIILEFRILRAVLWRELDLAFDEASYDPPLTDRDALRGVLDAHLDGCIARAVQVISPLPSPAQQPISL